MYLSIGGILLRHKLKEHFGFTLVETLIVMLIIGVMAGMVMVAAVNAFDNAAATKIPKRKAFFVFFITVCYLFYY